MGAEAAAQARLKPRFVHDTLLGSASTPRPPAPPFPDGVRAAPTSPTRSSRPLRDRGGRRDQRGLPGRARLLEPGRARPPAERGAGRGPARRRPGGRGGGRRLPRAPRRDAPPPRPHAPPLGRHRDDAGRRGRRARASCPRRAGAGPPSRRRGRGRWRGSSCARPASTRCTTGRASRRCTTRCPAGWASCACARRFRPRCARAGCEHRIELTRAVPAGRRRRPLPRPGRAGEPAEAARGSRRRVLLSHRAARLPGLADRLREIPGVTLVELHLGGGGERRPPAPGPPPPRGRGPALRDPPPLRARPTASGVPSEPLAPSPRLRGAAPDPRAHRGIARTPSAAGRLALGTAPPAGVRGLALRGDTTGVSRHHCTLQAADGEGVVEDHSSGGTFVNGERVVRPRGAAGGRSASPGKPGRRAPAHRGGGVGVARRKTEVFGLSFMDCICCGFGATILLYMVLNSGADAIAPRRSWGRSRRRRTGWSSRCWRAGQPRRAAQHLRADPAAERRRPGAVHPAHRRRARSRRRSSRPSSSRRSPSASTSTSCRPTSARWRRGRSGSPAGSRAARCRGTRCAPSWGTGTAST